MRLIIINILFAFMLWTFSSIAKADDKMIATGGHIISETMKGTNIDVSKLLEQELQNLAHNYAIEMANILQTYLPAILEGVASELRMKADHSYKCKLLENGGMKDGCI